MPLGGNTMDDKTMTWITQNRSNLPICNAVVKAGNRKILAKVLWDTSAEKTTISPILAGELGLEENWHGYSTIHKADIIFSDQFRLERVTVEEAPIPRRHIGVRIGMDVLSSGEFILSCLEGRTVFSFRSAVGSICMDAQEQYVDYEALVKKLK